MKEITGDIVDKRGTVSGPRFVFVDALRGVAAFAVLCHHLLHNSALQITLWAILPAWFAAFCHYGAYGVQIFFVLSGFVIAHSLRNVELSTSGMGNFMLRRQLRLDPPYWTVLVLTLVSLAIEMRVPWIDRKPVPGFSDIVRNLFYLQDLTGARSIVGVGWTLCLEVQFYLLFVLLLLVGRWLSKRATRATDVSISLLAVLGIVSILLPRDVLKAWFIQWWFYFASGALCYYAVINRRYRLPFGGFAAIFLVSAIVQRPLPMLVAWVTVFSLFIAGISGKLTRWLDIPVLQYLGRISYSLYLVHLLVAVYVLRFGYRITGNNPIAAVFWFVVGGIVSIFAAHLLYLAVERRSIQFAARFKRTRIGRAHPAEVTMADEQPRASRNGLHEAVPEL